MFIAQDQISWNYVLFIFHSFIYLFTNTWLIRFSSGKLAYLYVIQMTRMRFMDQAKSLLRWHIHPITWYSTSILITVVCLFTGDMVNACEICHEKFESAVRRIVRMKKCFSGMVWWEFFFFFTFVGFLLKREIAFNIIYKIKTIHSLSKYF